MAGRCHEVFEATVKKAAKTDRPSQQYVLASEMTTAQWDVALGKTMTSPGRPSLFSPTADFTEFPMPASECAQSRRISDDAALCGPYIRRPAHWRWQKET